MPGQKFSRICGTKIQLSLGDARRPEDKARNKMPTAWQKGRRGAIRVVRGGEKSAVLGGAKRCGIVMCLACGWENYNKLCYDIRLFWSLLPLD